MKRMQATLTKLSALALMLAPFMGVSGRDAIQASQAAANNLTLAAPATTPDVLLIDDDLSNGNRSAECHDYRSVYTQALTALGLTYQIFETTSTTPNPGTSPRPHWVNFEGASIYPLVIYFSGDRHCGQELGWNVPQMQAYLNGGGRMIVFSQDALYFDNQFAALSVPTTFTPTLYFGASYIADTIAVASVQGSSAFSYTSSLNHTIGVTETSIDRAGLASVNGADPAVILRNSADPTQIVGTRISSDPSIESEKGLVVRQNLAYRTQLVTYGLEGIPSASDRAKLLDALVGFEYDQVNVNSLTSAPDTNLGYVTTLNVTASSSITQIATGFSNSIVRYRWDFGDGSPVATTLVPTVNHTYATEGPYTVIVEATDGFGVRATRTLLIDSTLHKVLGSISPNIGPNDMSNLVTIFGSGMYPGIQISIGNTLLSTTWVNSTTVQAVVPSGLLTGNYTVTASYPNSIAPSLLQNAYTVFDPNSLVDDYFAGSEDLWTNPFSFYQGETPTLGLTVHRNGGLVSETVAVDFYVGDPDNGGRRLGGARTELIDFGAGNIGTASILWPTAPPTSTVDIYAVIDPSNQYSETSKLNNKIKHTFTILQKLGDITPPNIVTMTLNDGAQITNDPVISVTLIATDTGGSGVQSMYLIERMYNAAARQWVEVQVSGWIPYQEAFTMTLVNRGGVHYLQSWVADKSGNITQNSVMQRINYIQLAQQILAGDAHTYQLDLNQADHFTATLNTLSGDADLYVWNTSGISVGYSINSGLDPDVVSFTVPVSGVYDIEVDGYLSSTYNLGLTRTGGPLLLRPSRAPLSPLVGQIPTGKTPRNTPALQGPSTPVMDYPVPSAPRVVYKAFLPFVGNNTGLTRRTYIPMIINGINQ